MIQTFNLSGMTCTGCEGKVKKLLSGIEGVENVSTDLAKGEVTIDMVKHIPATRLKSALKDYQKYQLEEKQSLHHDEPAYLKNEAKSWLDTYKPLLIIFGYITGITLLLEMISGKINWESWMQNFMSGFFLVFSFFKLLDLKGFADSYATYDIIAMKWKPWGFAYAFIELGLGLAYLFKFQPLITNIVTFLVMSISIIGVLHSVLNKKKINCACLGAVFNLPMSTVTIFEDGLMIVMSLVTFMSLL